jgi:hypothetical protein
MWPWDIHLGLLLHTYILQWCDRSDLLSAVLAVVISFLQVIDNQWNPAQGKERENSNTDKCPSHEVGVGPGTSIDMLPGAMRTKGQIHRLPAPQ